MPPNGIERTLGKLEAGQTNIVKKLDDIQIVVGSVQDTIVILKNSDCRVVGKKAVVKNGSVISKIIKTGKQEGPWIGILIIGLLEIIKFLLNMPTP